MRVFESLTNVIIPTLTTQVFYCSTWSTLKSIVRKKYIKILYYGEQQLLPKFLAHISTDSTAYTKLDNYEWYIH